jgi:malate dehydrogenase (oxaloacetate-decarboxylating)(NADP+)
MCFPFLFRATLDTRSKQINEEMKMAAALALAGIARLPVPEEVKVAMPGREFTFGRDYVIPTPFDPRLITTLPVAVAKAAWASGTASIEIKDYEAYAKELTARVNN